MFHSCSELSNCVEVEVGILDSQSIIVSPYCLCGREATLDSRRNTKAWAVSQHTATSKDTKAWSVSQHTDTSKNTKAWAVSQHTYTSRNATAWAATQHTDTSRNIIIKIKNLSFLCMIYSSRSKYNESAINFLLG